MNNQPDPDKNKWRKIGADGGLKKRRERDRYEAKGGRRHIRGGDEEAETS